MNVEDIRPIRNKILVSDLESGQQVLASGLIIPDDDVTDRGIRPRWARVIAVGPECKSVLPGQYVLIEHGRWTRGSRISNRAGEDVVVRWVVDGEDHILLVADERPGNYVGDRGLSGVLPGHSRV
jgi:co-chaperonin GroES (HSP10)